MLKNVIKRKEGPRSTSESGENLGLWIDYDLIRKYQNRTHTIIHDPVASVNNRYLELADLALGKAKAKKKSKDAAAP